MPEDVTKLSELAAASLPTRWGVFGLRVYRWAVPTEHGLSQEHLALVWGDVQGQSAVPVRVHSECLTGEVFGSERCDCAGQLQAAQQYLSEQDRGLILYLRQEGRGIGLINKIKAYALQDLGADTVDANLQLHLPVDARQYDVAAAILQRMNVHSIRLITNNPDKVSGLEKLGIVVESRIPSPAPSSKYSRDYLQTKRLRLSHMIAPLPSLASSEDK